MEFNRRVVEVALLDAAKDLREWWEDGERGHFFEERKHFQFGSVGDANYKVETRRRISYWSLEPRWGQIKSIPGVRELARNLAPLLARNPRVHLKGRPNPDDEAAPSRTITDIVWTAHLVRGLVEAISVGSSTEPLIQGWLDRIESVVVRGEERYRHWAVLQNFDLEGRDRVEVGHYTLRRLDAEERSSLVSDYGLVLDATFSFHPEDVTRIGWVVERSVLTQRGESPDSAIKEDFEVILASLRTFQSGLVGMPAVARSDLNHFAGGTAYSPLEPVHPAWYDDVFKISADAVDEYTRFAEKFVKTAGGGKSGSLPLGVRRFSAAGARARAEDAFIDRVIALEALLLPGIGSELSYRFALRGAFLLAPTAGERPGWIERLREIYQTRNGLVHGRLATVPSDQASTADTACRQVLHSLIEVSNGGSVSQKAYQELLQRAEALCVSGGTREELLREFGSRSLSAANPK